MAHFFRALWLKYCAHSVGITVFTPTTTPSPSLLGHNTNKLDRVQELPPLDNQSNKRTKYIYLCRFQNVVLRCPTPRLHRFLSSHWPSFIRFFSTCVFSSPGWWGAGPSTQTPTWRTRVSLFVWMISFDLSGKADPNSSYATAGTVLSIIAQRKPPYPAIMPPSRWGYFKEDFILFQPYTFSTYSIPS